MSSSLVNKPKILFRLDAGKQAGYGHLSRNLALAEALSEKNIECIFLIKTDDDAGVKTFVYKRSQKAWPIEHIDIETDNQTDLEVIVEEFKIKGACFLILDHYAVDEYYQKKLKQLNIKWLQFDSHAKQKFYGDLVLHGSPGATQAMYESLRASHNTEFLLGSKYAVINNLFVQLRKQAKPRSQLKNILVCFGGGYDDGATLKTLEILKQLNSHKLHFTVITNKNISGIDNIEEVAKFSNHISLASQTSKIGELMTAADLAIFAPGTMSYEAVCLGLPMLLVTIADNQEINSKAWETTGCAIHLGTIDSLNKKIIIDRLRYLDDNTQILNEMSVKGFNCIDGLGALRVREEVLSLL